MTEDWAKVATEIEAALAEVGFAAVLEVQCDPGGPEGGAEYATQEAVTVLDDQIKRRDAGGMVTETVRMLTIKGNGTVPRKGWRVQVRGQWHRIAQVWPLAPGGVDLLFDLEVEG